MNINENNDYIVEARELLLEQFHDKSRIEDLLKSYIAQLQELEGVIYDLYSERLIDTAEGAQLDQLGELVGQERVGTDDVYRQFIKGRIAINRSNGKAEEILNVLILLSPTPDPGQYRLEDLGNASFLIEIMFGYNLSGAIFVHDLVQDMAAGGVNIFILWNAQPLGSRFQLSSQSGTLETDNNRGLSNAAMTTGGYLSGIVG